MGDYISRTYYCNKYCHCDNKYCDMVSCPIWKAPSADVAPVVHGRWIVHKPSERHNLNKCIECSECNTWFGHDCYAKTDFCPNCGARMDGGIENEDC